MVLMIIRCGIPALVQWVKNLTTEVPVVAQQIKTLTSIQKYVVPSLVLLSGLRIQHCCNLSLSRVPNSNRTHPLRLPTSTSQRPTRNPNVTPRHQFLAGRKDNSSLGLFTYPTPIKSPAEMNTLGKKDPVQRNWPCP